MALRRQLLEQVEDARASARFRARSASCSRWHAASLVFQALQFAEPLPLRFQRLELLLQRFQFVELSLMFVLQNLALLGSRQAAGLLLQTGEAFLRLLAASKAAWPRRL